MGAPVSNCSALAYYPSERLVTHNLHQSCVRTDLSTVRHLFTNDDKIGHPCPRPFKRDNRFYHVRKGELFDAFSRLLGASCECPCTLRRIHAYLFRALLHGTTRKSIPSLPHCLCRTVKNCVLPTQNGS